MGQIKSGLFVQVYHEYVEHIKRFPLTPMMRKRSEASTGPLPKSFYLDDMVKRRTREANNWLVLSTNWVGKRDSVKNFGNDRTIGIAMVIGKRTGFEKHNS